jgi:hypothetical protein
MEPKEVVERFIHTMGDGKQRQIWKISFGVTRKGAGEDGKDEYDSVSDCIVVGTLDQVVRHMKMKAGADSIRHIFISPIESFIDLGGN